MEIEEDFIAIECRPFDEYVDPRPVSRADVDKLGPSIIALPACKTAEPAFLRIIFVLDKPSEAWRW